MGVRRELEANFDFEIVDEFLEHFSMMVDVMEPLIINLGKKSSYKNDIGELFRIFHNLKSASSFLKLEPIIRLSTFVESALETLREEEGPANEEVITWLLSISDMFEKWYDDLKLDNELSKIEFSLLKLPDMDKN
ncbi:Hpt domain-containing protein [Sulfurimonas sp. HSL-1716]|uniref:Hpt domain-containing protein n=1 Tax=Hydrocurvibacter sulfurireducens TaxID=3131937 RepID=UPI0031F9C34A